MENELQSINSHLETLVEQSAYMLDALEYISRQIYDLIVLVIILLVLLAVVLAIK